nr:hypothetical protein [Tanacetum cinerariifolium]
MSADVARSHGGDGGGEDRPLHTMQTKAQFGRQGSGQAEYLRQDPEPFFKGNHGYKRLRPDPVIRGVPLYYPSWLKVPKKQKAALITYIGTQFDLRPHMESPDWTEINAGIQHHLQKAYNTNKAAFKAQHWVIDPTTGTYNVKKIRRARPANITASEWDKSFSGNMSSGNICHRGAYFLTEKYVGPTVSSGIVAGEGIIYERSPATIPRQQVAGETYPQRQVAGESLDLSLGKRLNVVVLDRVHQSIKGSTFP